MRMIGCSEGDMRLLLVKKFIIAFDTGIIVIKHWRIHNYIQTDRYVETKYKEEKAMLENDENNSYRLKESSYTPCIQAVSEVDTQIKLNKTNLNKRSTVASAPLTPSIEIPPILETWLRYKKERKELYKETGLKALITKTLSMVSKYGESAVSEVINDSISSNYKGIVWDWLGKKQAGGKQRIADIKYGYPQHNYTAEQLKGIAVNLEDP